MKKFFQLGGFIPIASQLQLLKLLENMVNCSLDNLEIISVVYCKRPLGEMCDCKSESHITSSIHLHWLGSIRTGDMMSLTSLSTIFQSHHDGVWLLQEAQRSLL